MGFDMSMPAEISAMCDALDKFLIDSEALSIEDAVEVWKELPRLKSKANLLSRAIDKRVKDQLEGQTRQFGDLVIEVVPKWKWRTNHQQVKSLIIEFAQNNPVTGEFYPTGQAVQRAVDFVYSAYVTWADQPKSAFLREFGLTVEDVSLREETGRDLHVKQADEDEKPSEQE